MHLSYVCETSQDNVIYCVLTRVVSEVFLSLVQPNLYILELGRQGYTSVGEIVGMNNLRSRFSDVRLKQNTGMVSSL